MIWGLIQQILMQLRMLMTVHILTEVQYLATSYKNYSYASSPHKSVADFSICRTCEVMRAGYEKIHDVASSYSHL